MVDCVLGAQSAEVKACRIHLRSIRTPRRCSYRNKISCRNNVGLDKPPHVHPRTLSRARRASATGNAYKCFPRSKHVLFGLYEGASSPKLDEPTWQGVRGDSLEARTGFLQEEGRRLAHKTQHVPLFAVCLSLGWCRLYLPVLSLHHERRVQLEGEVEVARLLQEAMVQHDDLVVGDG